MRKKWKNMEVKAGYSKRVGSLASTIRRCAIS